MIHKCHWSPLTSESLLAYWFLFQSTSEPMISDRWVVNGGSNRYTLFTTPSTTGSLFWDQSNVFIVVHLTLMHEQSLDPQEPTFQTSPCRGFYLLTHTREWKLAAQQQQPWRKKKKDSICVHRREGGWDAQTAAHTLREERAEEGRVSPHFWQQEIFTSSFFFFFYTGPALRSKKGENWTRSQQQSALLYFLRFGSETPNDLNNSDFIYIHR